MGSHQEYVPHHPKPEVVYDLPLNLQGLESAFAHCVEFASREIVLVQGGHLYGVLAGWVGQERAAQRLRPAAAHYRAGSGRGTKGG